MAQPRPSTAPTLTREQQREALLNELRPKIDAILGHVVDQWLDTPEHQELGAIEYTLRDAGQAIAATVHQTGLASRKKRATWRRACRAAIVIGRRSS